MANTQTQPDAESRDTPGSSEPSSRQSLLGKIKVAGFISAVIGIECAVAWIYIPSAEEVQAMADMRAGAELMDEDLDVVAEQDDENALEVDLGEFAVTSYQPNSNSALRIDFRLFGTVSEADYEEFLDLYSRSENRIREQVIVTTRNSEITDLTDPNLALLKRQILDTTNRTIGKRLLQEVGFGDFSFIEQ